MTSYYVANANQLNTAISRAVGGDSIVLAPGRYGSVDIANKMLSSVVSIKAASSGVFLTGISVKNSANLSFSGLDVGRSLTPGEREYTTLSRVADSKNISFDRTSFHGSPDGTPSNDGRGLTVINTSGFSVKNSTFRELSDGLIVYTSDQVTIQSNRFDTIKADGIDSAGNSNVLIDGNQFANFKPAADTHGDAIQFFNSGQARGQSNIVISNNVIMEGSGAPIQGIYLGNPGAYGYFNVTLANNLVYMNGGYNGILAYGVTGLRLSGNSVLSNPSDKKVDWISLNDSRNIELTNNVADWIQLPNSTNVTQSGNIDLYKLPQMRSLFADLFAPDSHTDLVIPGHGYQAQRGTIWTNNLGPETPTNPASDPNVQRSGAAISAPPVSSPLTAPVFLEKAALDANVGPLLSDHGPVHVARFDDYFNLP